MTSGQAAQPRHFENLNYSPIYYKISEDISQEKALFGEATEEHLSGMVVPDAHAGQPQNMVNLAQLIRVEFK